MAWGDVESNQMVTDTNMQTSGIALNAGQSATSLGKCMTKSELITRYNVNTSLMSSYASNQLVPRSVIASGVVSTPVEWFINISNAAGSGTSLVVIISINSVELVNISLSDGQSYANTFTFYTGDNMELTVIGTSSGTSIYSNPYIYNYTYGTELDLYDEGVGYIDINTSYSIIDGDVDFSINLDPAIVTSFDVPYVFDVGFNDYSYNGGYVSYLMEANEGFGWYTKINVYEYTDFRDNWYDIIGGTVKNNALVNIEAEVIPNSSGSYLMYVYSDGLAIREDYTAYNEIFVFDYSSYYDYNLYVAESFDMSVYPFIQGTSDYLALYHQVDFSW